MIRAEGTIRICLRLVEVVGAGDEVEKVFELVKGWLMRVMFILHRGQGPGQWGMRLVSNRGGDIDVFDFENRAIVSGIL